MKQDWNHKKLTDLCAIQYGFAFDSSYFNDSGDGLPLIRIRDVVRGFSETYYNGAYPPEYIVKEGDYLIGMDGEFNIAQWRGDEALLNQRVCKISSKSDSYTERFAYYFLSRILKEIEDETPFVTVKHLSAKRLNQILTPVPSIEEQTAICSLLDKLSLVIEKKKEQVKQLDDLAQSIFYDTFGDPVENEKGWELKSIDSVCKAIVRGPFGSALKKEFFVPQSNDTYKVYEQKHAINKDISIGEYFITNEKFKELRRFEVFPLDIIMSCSGTIGELFQIPIDAPKGVMNQALLKFTLNNTILPSMFIRIMGAVKENMVVHGCGLQNIGSVKEIKQTTFGLPPISLQQSFAQKVEAIERQKELINQSIAEVQTLFDSQMEYYFGE